MSGVFSERSSDDVTSGPRTACSSTASTVAVKEVMLQEHDREPGLFAALCRKFLCQRGHDDEDTGEVCRVHNGGLCSLCCGGLYPRRSERHHTVVSSSKQISVRWLPSSGSGSVEATTRQPGTTSRHHQLKCSCTNDLAASDSCEASASRACAQNDLQPGGVVRHCGSQRVSDSWQRGKQSATMRRVMLADAAYGHATVLDDCVPSDSDAWSGSLTLSQPNSGTNSLERGATAAQENADEMYESYSDEGEGEDDVMWPTVTLPLPALPVYDQV